MDTLCPPVFRPQDVAVAVPADPTPADRAIPLPGEGDREGSAAFPPVCAPARRGNRALPGGGMLLVGSGAPAPTSWGQARATLFAPSPSVSLMHPHGVPGFAPIFQPLPAVLPRLFPRFFPTPPKLQESVQRPQHVSVTIASDLPFFRYSVSCPLLLAPCSLPLLLLFFSCAGG